MPASASGPEYKYFAFLSYSRKDSAAARWLQRRLEWFRFPVALVPEEHRPGHPRYIRPIYRDKTNLEVDHAHYWENIRTALEQSRYLVILCSPHAAASGPVDAEVRHFLASHGQRLESLAPVILSGNVTAAGEGGMLCPALSELGESITSRNLPTMIPDAGAPERDGWENGFVSLVSYLLHIHRTFLSDHIRREERRQKVRSRVLAGGFAVLACAAIAGGVIAWQQHQTAVANEAKAIGASRSGTATAQQRLTEGKWREAVAYLGRAIRYDPENRNAQDALWLTMRYGRRDAGLLPLHTLTHRSSVTVAAFSPDGSRILTASRDHTARLWDAKTGQPLGVPMQHSDIVNSAVFSPDGTRIVTTTRGQKIAHLWDGKTGEPSGTPMVHPVFHVTNATFSPDGTRVITTCHDGTVRFWSAKTGQPAGTPLVHKPDMTFAAFSPDGTCIVSGGAANATQLWNAKTGQPIGPPLPHGFILMKAAFSPDSAKVVTAFYDGTVQLLDAKTSIPLGNPLKHTDAVTDAQFSPGGSLILTACVDGTVQVWDAKTGTRSGIVMEHRGEVMQASFSPDGTRILTASADYTARLWDSHTHQPLGAPMEHSQSICSASFNADGSLIVTASVDDTARVWDAHTGQLFYLPLETSTKLKNQGNKTVLSPDGSTRAVIADGVHPVQLLDAKTGQPLGTPMVHYTRQYGVDIVIVDIVKAPKSVNTVAFSPDGTRIITAGGDYAIRIWDGKTCQPIGVPLEHQQTVQTVQFSKDGLSITTESGLEDLGKIYTEGRDVKAGQPLDGQTAELLTSFFSGARLDPELGSLRMISPEERRKLWQELEPALASLPDWKFATEQVFPRDPKRTPGSTLMPTTVREAATRLLDTLAPEHIHAALEADPAHPLLPLAWAALESGTDYYSNTAHPVAAAWFCDYGMKHLPADVTAEELRVGAKLLLKAMKSLPELKGRALELLDRAAKLEPETREMKAFREKLR